MTHTDFNRYIYAIQVDKNKKVQQISLNIKGEDFTGEINVTDLQLQAGLQATAPAPTTSEILEQISFTIDENEFLNTSLNPVKVGVQPQIYSGITNRFFNIVGRGAEVIALPNVVPEDYTQDLVTSALDLTLTAKGDFDLVRISTNNGALVSGRMYDPLEYPPLAEHPLNHKYTREFYFGKGVAGDEIKLNTSEFTASLAGVKQPLAQGKLVLDGQEIESARQQLTMAPYGTFRVRIEFYKNVTEVLAWTDEYGTNEKEVTYLKNTGIGFYGYAEFNQIKRRARY